MFRLGITRVSLSGFNGDYWYKRLRGPSVVLIRSPTPLEVTYSAMKTSPLPLPLSALCLLCVLSSLVTDCYTADVEVIHQSGPAFGGSGSGGGGGRPPKRPYDTSSSSSSDTESSSSHGTEDVFSSLSSHTRLVQYFSAQPNQFLSHSEIFFFSSDDECDPQCQCQLGGGECLFEDDSTSSRDTTDSAPGRHHGQGHLSRKEARQMDQKEKEQRGRERARELEKARKKCKKQKKVYDEKKKRCVKPKAKPKPKQPECKKGKVYDTEKRRCIRKPKKSKHHQY